MDKIKNSGKRNFWNERMETMPEEEMTKLRFRKLLKQLEYVYDNSEFYKNKFDDSGAHPKDIKDLESFRKLPIFLTKEDHRKSQEDSMKKCGHGLGTFVCVALDKIVLISATSGTTGPPTYYLFSKKDLEVQAEISARQLWRTGCRAGDVVLQGAGLSGLYLGGAPVVYYQLNHGLGTLVPLGAETGAKKLIETVLATKATILMATPSYLQHINEIALKVIGKETSELGIRILLAIGEPGAGLPEVRKKLQEAYNARVYDLIGPGTNFAAVSCDADYYQGMHVVSADYMIHEDVVDPSTKTPLKIQDGVIGEQIRTALDKEAGPFIRYSVGDIIQVLIKPCSCGLPGHRIKVVGRVDDMLIVKGVNVFPAAIKNVITSFSPKVTGEFRIVLTEPPPRVIPPLRLKVEHSPDIFNNQLEDLKKAIEQEMHTNLRVRPKVELLPPNTLKRTATKIDFFEKNYENS